MLENRFITASQFMSDIKMSGSFADELTMEQLVSFIVTYPQRWCFKNMFEKKIATLEIGSNISSLPCDFHDILYVRDNPSNILYRRATDVFFLSGKTPEGYRDFTYKINGDAIMTSVSEGKVDISYIAIKTGSDGLPMVWAEQAYIDALKSFIKERVYMDYFDEGRITEKSLNYAQQDYAFNAKLLQKRISSVTPDEVLAISTYSNNIVKTEEFDDGFINIGDNKNSFKI